MRKFMAVVLSAAVLCCHMNIFAGEMENLPIEIEEMEDYVVLSGNYRACAVKGNNGEEFEVSVNEISQISENDNTVKDTPSENGSAADLDNEIENEEIPSILSKNEMVSNNEIIDEEMQEELENAVQIISDNEEIQDVVSENGLEIISNNEVELESEEIQEVKSENAIRSISNNEDEVQIKDDFISNVSVPTAVKVYLDSQNISGKGEVFSETYEIVNYGNRDVAIKINKIDVSYKCPQDSYELSKEKIEDNYSYEKKMNINVVWENKSKNQKKILNVVEGEQEECVIYLKAAKYDEAGNFIKLKKGSKGSFYFTGTLNSNPNIEWNEQGISIDFDYEIIDPNMQMNGENEEEYIKNEPIAVNEDNMQAENVEVDE